MKKVKTIVFLLVCMAGLAVVGRQRIVAVKAADLDITGVAWRWWGNDIYNANYRGKVGVGTMRPEFTLDVNGVANFRGDVNIIAGYNLNFGNGSISSDVHGDNILISDGSKVGIGIANPTQRLEVNGGVRMNTATSKPSCNDSTRGLMWFTMGVGSSGKDGMEVCAREKDGVNAWRTLF